jgi:hypothetical protein
MNTTMAAITHAMPLGIWLWGNGFVFGNFANPKIA